jgi:hypothetical protein
MGGRSGMNETDRKCAHPDRMNIVFRAVAPGLHSAEN